MFLCVAAVASSCNSDEVITLPPAPKIILEGDGIYSVKCGYEIRIAPEYRDAEDATYSWVIEGETVCTERAYVHYGAELGSVYVTLTVANDNGSDSRELRIDVVQREIPTIAIFGASNRCMVVGSSELFTATVRECSIPATIKWQLAGEDVGEGETYLFNAESVGSYELRAIATNADGESSDSVTIEVVERDESFVWEFEKTEYHSVVGRKVRIAPTTLSDPDVAISWQVDDALTIAGEGSSFSFVSEVTGEHTVTATAHLANGESRVQEFSVMLYDEMTYYRTATTTSAADCTTVLDYTPAPGQFIGDYKTAGFDGTEVTQDSANIRAMQRLAEHKFVSLGAFGGYIVLGFDHSILNSAGYDIAIIGNSFESSCEPGVVWVMQDENGNGKADDTWYELRGSESGKESTIQEYTVTYYRPAGSEMPVMWEDSLGERGEVEYLKSFHDQPSYYPTWVSDESYTLRGTRLEARNYDASGNGSMWIQPPYDWGYADNYSSTDIILEDGEGKVNGFDIANAMDFEGESVALNHVDFVKVQCAVQATSGWVGELSTEILGAYDIYLAD